MMYIQLKLLLYVYNYTCITCITNLNQDNQDKHNVDHINWPLISPEWNKRFFDKNYACF